MRLRQTCSVFKPNRHVAWLWLFVAFIIQHASGAPSGAGQPNGPADFKRMSLEELSQIDVTTPSKQPEKAFESPVAIYVLTGQQIRASGATSIPEALRLAPGVEVARIDANKWSIGIRGFGSRFSRGVLVLIDGRTVYTTLLAGTYWEVQDTMMDDIDRIEVIRGPGGTIWGPNAVNGVINIITKDSRDTHGMLASAGGGNEEQGFANFRYGGGNDKDFNYRIYGKSFTRGPDYHTDQRNYDDWRATQAGFRMDWTKSEDWFTVQGDLYREGAGESVGVTTYSAPYSQIIDANANLSGGNVLGRWTHKLASGDSLQLQAYYDRTNRYEPNFDDIRDTFDVDFLDTLRLPARQRISWGLGARFSLIDDHQVVSGLAFQPNRRTDDIFTAFIQDEIGLVDQRLTLTLGTKLLRTNFSGVQPEPSARLAWTPTESQTVWASFTHALRTPSDSEENFSLTGYTGSQVNGLPFLARFNPNPSFTSEQLNGYEAGYRRKFSSKVQAGFAGFYNHYHDLFDEELSGPAFVENDPPPVHLLLPARFGNGLLGTTKGVEFTPAWEVGKSLQIRGSYSFLQMDIRKAPNSGDIGTAPGIVGSSPRHEATIQSSLDISKTLSLDLVCRYVSALPAATVAAYSTGDARLAWRFTPQLELALAGRNLFQPFHGESGGDPGPVVDVRRSVYVKLTWSK